MKRLLLTLTIIFSLLPVPAEAHRRHRRAVQVVTPQLLACIRAWESGGDYTKNTGNGYFGAYQFDRRKWRIWFGNLHPSQVSPEWQDAQAVVLLTQSRKGLGHWPVPNRRCRG